MALVAGAGAAGGAAASETTTFQGDAGHSGGVLDPALDGPLHVLWTQRLSKSLSYPLAAGGRVFVVSPVPGDSPVGEVVALDAATGAPLWRRSLARATDLTYGEGTLYALDQHGVVTALDPATGVTRWAKGPASLDISRVYKSPVYAKGTIFYVGLTGDEGSALVALGAQDGTLRWHAPFTTYLADAGVAADDQGVYLGYECGFGFSFTHAGAQRWSTQTSCPGQASGFGEQVVVADGRALTDSRSGAVLSTATGAIVDTFTRTSVPAFGVGHVAWLGEHGRLTFADRATLTPTLTYTADNPDVSQILGRPFFVGDRAFVQDNRHHLIGVDGATAAVSADVDLNVQLAPPNDPPVEGSGGIAVAGGVIAVATTDGRVVGVTGAGGPTPPGADTPTIPPTSTPTPVPPGGAPGATPIPFTTPKPTHATSASVVLPAAARRVTVHATRLGLLRRHGLTLTIAGARPGATADAIVRAGGKVVWHARARVPKGGHVRLTEKARRTIRAKTARLEIRVSAAHAKTLILRRTLR
ncbi:outer membrane protein assembly factor BamB family protein [Baekduia sp. Peel2402]|uniref:outer membrane protein assembly factor BamB family protein n=1 Tax=Baekduia sp. Peel2402 TaxID=3458296 RepID=UPI00403EC97D